MRPFSLSKAALLTPLLGLGVLCGTEFQVSANPPSPPVEKKAESCGAFGTSVEFAESPSEAAKQAKKEEKLVFVLHVSGNFEDPRFT